MGKDRCWARRHKCRWRASSGKLPSMLTAAMSSKPQRWPGLAHTGISREGPSP